MSTTAVAQTSQYSVQRQSGAMYDGAHIYLTVADEDENQVLELVKSDESGMYIRDNKVWVRIDPDDDNDRVWDRTIIDVTPDATDAFDTAEATGQPVTADQFTDYEIVDGDTQ